MEDEPVSVKGYKEDGEGGEEATAGLDGTDHLAENVHLWSPGPVLGQNIYAKERHGEGAEQDVRDGQGGDEHISGGEHHLQRNQYYNILSIQYCKLLFYFSFNAWILQFKPTKESFCS